MISAYKYTVDDAVLAIFAVVSKRQRETLLGIFNALTDNPFIPEDSLQRDHIGRSLSVRRFGEWTVTYWPEHLASRIHIVAIEHLRV